MDTAAPLLPLLIDRLEPLRHLCDRYGVDRLEVFGSAAKGLFDPANSDLDFIVQMRVNGNRAMPGASVPSPMNWKPSSAVRWIS